MTAVRRVRALRVQDGAAREREEQLAVEEPLEVRVGEPGRPGSRRLAVTMRTPGADFELAVGWLYGEGLVDGRSAVRQVAYCTDVDLTDEERFNVVTVDVTSPLPPTAGRAFVVSSACGVCGREAVDDLRHRCRVAPPAAAAESDWLAGLPERLRAAQAGFARTGGLHAAGLFLPGVDEPLVVREDVGRHNAVDKVVGWALLADRLPLHDVVLAVSGRASYEIVAKAVAAGVPAVVAVSAPSSLAVDLAGEFGLLLAAFVRDGRLTVYSGRERLAVQGAATVQ